MADETSSTISPPPLSPSPPPFVEVFCNLSGKKYRFACGTKAEFAVALINKNLGFVNPRAIYIEAVKEGEEPINFGPHADLVDYGHDWKLKTVTDSNHPGTETSDGVPRRRPRRFPSASLGLDDSKSTRKTARQEEAEQGLSLVYIGKILVAFVLMFVLGALFTITLENLPKLISLFNSSM